LLILSYISLMNTIHWQPKALRQAHKIANTKARAAIFEGVQVLGNFPDCQGVKKLTNHEYAYRLRVGDFRVFFEFDGAIKIVLIEEVRRRNERTY
jgi:mRNA interferase RelE/StbE